MNKLQEFELMEKVLRELQDLEKSQTSVLKKLSQIEAHNMTLGVALLEDKLPDLHRDINSSVTIVSEILEAFTAHRDKFLEDNKKALEADPTA